MYKAKFVAGWATIDCQGETLDELIRELNDMQDLGCLVMNGLYRGMGTEEDAPQLMKLGDFVDKWAAGELVEDDIRNFHYDLSLGKLACVEFVKE